MDPQQLLARFRTAASALAPRQLVTLGMAFVSVVGVVIASAYWMNRPAYEVLLSDMDPESAGAVVERLKTAKVDYVLDDGGRTVKVPASRLNELRLEVASQGMPSSGRIGFEIFDRTSFGVTDFMEHVNFRRALEGELARTIASIGEVAGARVHIAIPQKSLFVGQAQPTTASVVLKLRQDRQLPPSTVTAITSLVAASVESLRPESVVVIDNFGRPLARPTPESDRAGGEPLDRQSRVEQDLSVRVVTLLEPIVGPGRARVNVAATIDTDTQEETEERYDPTPIVRSQQTTQSATGTSLAVVASGARANLPANPSAPAPPALTTAPSGGNASSSQTTNFELSKLTRRRVQPQGQIARLSVAVVLDDNHQPSVPGSSEPPKTAPRTQDEIKKIHDLVAAAVGLNTERGDQLTVENIAFEEGPVEEVAEIPVWERFEDQGFELFRIVGILLLAILAIFGVVRPMMRGSMPPPAKASLSPAGTPGTLRPKTVQEIESEMDAELEAAVGTAGSKRLPALTRRATAFSQKEPANAARLLRAWLTEEER